MRLVRLLVAALLLVANDAGASAQSAYPDRPIKMIVPLAAASAVDVAARASRSDGRPCGPEISS